MPSEQAADDVLGLLARSRCVIVEKRLELLSMKRAQLAAKRQRDEAVQEALETLRPMEADILRHRFGLDGTTTMTLREVGEMHGLSRERIRQLQERALKKIRTQLQRHGFDAQEGASA